MADPLATSADVEARIGPLSDSQSSRVHALLTDASGLVRGFARQDFSVVEGDVVTLRPIGTELTLPQRPVVDVTAVVAVGGRDGIPDIPIGGWLWDGLDSIEVHPLSWRTAIDFDLEPDIESWSPDSYRVTYDHGYAEVPDDVIAVVCGMVNRVLTSPTMVEGLTSERIGQYGYQFAQFSGGQSPGPTVRLTEADKQALIDAGYRRTAGTVQMRT